MPNLAHLIQIINMDGVLRPELNEAEISKLDADGFITLLGTLEALKYKVYELSAVAYEE